MAYDPTPQVPPPQGYPPQQNYPQAPPPAPQYSGQPPAPAGSPNFDVGTFWKGLGMQGQIAGLASLVLLLSLFLPWFSFSYSVNCTGIPGCASTSTGSAANAWSSTNGGGLPGGVGFGFTLLWLVILATFVLIALHVIVALRKLSAQQGQMFILITAGVALLCEIIYLFSAFGAVKGGTVTSFGFSENVSAGPGFGFWIGLLATIAAGGAYVYFSYVKKRSAAGAPMAAGYQQPYQPPNQYPGQLPPHAPGQ